MARVVMLQFSVAFLIAIIAATITALVGGQPIAVGFSALAGGLCCAIPNALFAFSLYVGTKKPKGANPTSFFVGEFLKIMTTIALLVMVVLLYHDIHWLAFLVSFILVLKSYFILLLKKLT